MIQILIVDDHPLVIDGVRTMLQDADGFIVSGACKSAEETFSFLETSQPDVILLDISLPDLDGLQLCEKIHGLYPGIKIIGLTSTNESGIIISFMKRGGNGYLLKNMERSELLDALNRVLDGYKYISKAANDKVLEAFSSMNEAINHIPAITRREKEIMELLDKGFTGPQIAEKLFLSHFTVETHRKNLMKKLHANNVQMLLNVAREYRLLP